MGNNNISAIDGRVLGGVSAGIYRRAPWHVRYDANGVEVITDNQGRVLGQKSALVDDVRDVETMAELADLLWEPKELSLGGSTLIVPQGFDAPTATTLVSDRKLLVRPDWPSVNQAYELGAPSEKYGVIPNNVGLQFVAEILKHRSDAMLRSITTLYGGKIIFAVVEFQDGVQVTRRNGTQKDKHTPFMGIYWSHDGSHPLGVKYMRHEWVCENTFTPWNAETGLVIRHTRFAEDRATDAIRAIEGMLKAQDAFDEEIRHLIEAEITKDDFRAIVRGTIGPRPDSITEKKTTIAAYDKVFEGIVSEWNSYTDQTSAFDAVMAVQGYEQWRKQLRGGGRDVKTITNLLRDNYPMTIKAAKAATLVTAP